MKNNNRYDLSNFLIHFFREIDPKDTDTPVLPENCGFHSIENWEAPFTPFFMLRNAVRHGRVWATWAIRGGKRTIYGHDPAVCFTEMPIAAFLEAGAERARRGGAMSAFGLVFAKSGLHQIGARPVIYGLDDSPRMANTNGPARVIDHTQLASAEQYRYVTFEPAANRPIDWSHEREWRWPLRTGRGLEAFELPPAYDDICGLDLDTPSIGALGAIVRTKDQADRLLYDILMKIDRGDITPDHYSFVLPTDEVSEPADLRDPASLNRAIDQAAVTVSEYAEISLKTAKRLARRFSLLVKHIEGGTEPYEIGQAGGCWLWVMDNRTSLIRALIKTGRAFVNKDGKYLIRLDGFDQDRSLRQRQNMTMRLADKVKKEFRVSGTYFSVADKTCPDELPIFCGVHDDDPVVYNHSDLPSDT